MKKISKLLQKTVNHIQENVMLYIGEELWGDFWEDYNCLVKKQTPKIIIQIITAFRYIQLIWAKCQLSFFRRNDKLNQKTIKIKKNQESNNHVFAKLTFKQVNYFFEKNNNLEKYRTNLKRSYRKLKLQKLKLERLKKNQSNKIFIHKYQVSKIRNIKLSVVTLLVALLLLILSGNKIIPLTKYPTPTNSNSSSISSIQTIEGAAVATTTPYGLRKQIKNVQNQQIAAELRQKEAEKQQKIAEIKQKKAENEQKLAETRQQEQQAKHWFDIAQEQLSQSKKWLEVAQKEQHQAQCFETRVENLSILLKHSSCSDN